MNKDKSLSFRFEKWDEFKTRTQAALKDLKSYIAEKNTISFSSVEGYQKFMTEQKIVRLAEVIRHKPSSIGQLTQVLECDFVSVQRDCSVLESVGINNI